MKKSLKALAHWPLGEFDEILDKYPDSKVHVTHMGPTWFLSAPGRPHMGPMNLAIRVIFKLILVIDVWGVSSEITLRRMSLDLTN